VVREAAVAAADMAKKLSAFIAVLAIFFVRGAHALVLPEDRADVMYHAYDGGGVTVDGPSVLVRKGYKEKVSAYANYYQDMVSSASIDVLTSGSKYSEERTEYSVGMDYLADRALISLGYTNSSESDYEAKTVSFGISQDFFGDMTTLALGYSRGDDEVLKNQDDGASLKMGDAQRQRYSLGLSQILTRSWIVSLSAETVVDDGFLRNPYRQIRYLPQPGEGDIAFAEEAYPETRNSDAFAIRTMYYLPYRASLRLEARKFSDSWGIKAENYEIRYTHSVRSRMIFEIKARTYSQTQADFYQDLFPYENAFEFMGRDKELSTYNVSSFGLGLTYEFGYKLPFAKKHSASFYWDFMRFDYENFRNALLSREADGLPAEYRIGEEPTYAFEANVIRLFYTVNY
jgi:hypothetical protein